MVAKAAVRADLYSACVDDLLLAIVLLADGLPHRLAADGRHRRARHRWHRPAHRRLGSHRRHQHAARRGWGRAIGVAVLDLAKGAVPILIAVLADAPVEVQALTGLAAVLGSWKSIFLRFHGGRGVATGVGGMIAIAPLDRARSPCRPSSSSSGSRATSRWASILGTAFGAGCRHRRHRRRLARSRPGCSTSCPGEVIIWVAHRDNIGRLLAGTERKFSAGDRTADAPRRARRRRRARRSRTEP